MEDNASRAEAERLLRIADKLLQGRDLTGSRDFAILAQENEPLLEGSDQILAIADVLLCADRRVNNHHDWYAILQVDRRSDDLDLIKKQYRRLALLLHPDKNKFAFADSAFKLVVDAWAVLSDPVKKSFFDNELGFFSKVDLVAVKNNNQRSQVHRQFRPHNPQPPVPAPTPTPAPAPAPAPVPEEPQHQKLPVRRGSGPNAEETRPSSFWTTCPYCYNIYQYPMAYEECCLRCQNCQRAFQATQIPSLPPLVPGKEAYYCCWGFFPLGFVANSESGEKNTEFPNWMPPIFPAAEAAAPDVPPPPPPPPPPETNGGGVGFAPPPPEPNGGGVGFVDVSSENATPIQPVGPVAKKRGRPRKKVQ